MAAKLLIPRTVADVPKAWLSASRDSTWILTNRRLTRRIVQEAMRAPRSRPHGQAVVMHDIELSELPPLAQWFRNVVFSPDGKHLPIGQVIEVLTSPHPDELIIGGSVDPHVGAVTLWRGDLTSVTIPFDWFASSGRVPPDFDDFEVIDFGHAVRFGDYEAATETILREHDPVFRRRRATRDLERNPSLGAKLRVARKRLGLGRDAFGNISDKTIARIERNETKPRKATLRAICSKLGISEDHL